MSCAGGADCSPDATHRIDDGLGLGERGKLVYIQTGKQALRRRPLNDCR